MIPPNRERGRIQTISVTALAGIRVLCILFVVHQHLKELCNDDWIVHAYDGMVVIEASAPGKRFRPQGQNGETGAAAKVKTGKRGRRPDHKRETGAWTSPEM